MTRKPFVMNEPVKWSFIKKGREDFFAALSTPHPTQEPVFVVQMLFLSSIKKICSRQPC